MKKPTEMQSKEAQVKIIVAFYDAAIKLFEEDGGVGPSAKLAIVSPDVLQKLSLQARMLGNDEFVQTAEEVLQKYSEQSSSDNCNRAPRREI